MGRDSGLGIKGRLRQGCLGALPGCRAPIKVAVGPVDYCSSDPKQSQNGNQSSHAPARGERQPPEGFPDDGKIREVRSFHQTSQCSDEPQRNGAGVNPSLSTSPQTTPGEWVQAGCSGRTSGNTSKHQGNPPSIRRRIQSKRANNQQEFDHALRFAGEHRAETQEFWGTAVLNTP